MRNLVSAIILFSFSFLLFSAPGDLIWKTDIGGATQGKPCIDTDHKMVFVHANDKYIYAFNALNGMRKWEYFAGNCTYYNYPVYFNGKIYTGKNAAYLIVLNATNGELLWTFNTRGGYSFPEVFNGILYMGSPDTYFYSLNSDNGSLLWESNTYYANYTPCLGDTLLFFSGVEKSTASWTNLFCLSATNGIEKWSYRIDNANISIPSCYNNLVFYGSPLTDKNLYSFNAQNGTVVWKYKTNGKVGSPVVWDTKELVYVSSSDNNVYCCDALTGKLVWKYDAGGVCSTPCISEGYVFFSSLNGYITSLNASNSDVFWKYNADAGSLQGLTYGLQNIYCASGQQYLYAVEAFDSGFKNNKSASHLPAKSFSVSPNPFSSRLSLSLPSSGAIYSLTGQLIMKLDKGKHSVDTSKWREGVYIIKSNKKTKKIIKM
ncbi:MAG: PQQ-binding-like beta-propeller repeat protein [Candidatus Coatesbacteria bacterium]|nr:PQQ-binding-like beta-propeller repeat protein [Candidatus Coatesbacteria bacterium]